MTASIFLETNVLVNAAVGTGRDGRKRERALDLIESEDFGTSAQVLQEFFVTVVKKAKEPLSPAQALEWVEQFTAFPFKRSIINWCGLRLRCPPATRLPTGMERFSLPRKLSVRVLSTPKI